MLKMKRQTLCLHLQQTPISKSNVTKQQLFNIIQELKKQVQEKHESSQVLKAPLHHPFVGLSKTASPKSHGVTQCSWEQYLEFGWRVSN